MSSSNEKNDNSCNKQAETDDVSRKRSREEDKQEEGGEQKKVAKEKVPVVFIHMDIDCEIEVFFREDGEISMQLETVFEYATQNQHDRDILDQTNCFVHSAISENEHSERWIDENLFSDNSDMEDLKKHFNQPGFLEKLVDLENGKWTHITEEKLDKNNGFFGFNGKPCRVYMFN